MYDSNSLSKIKHETVGLIRKVQGIDMVAKRILVIGMTDNPGGIESLMLGVLSNLDLDKVCLDFVVNTETVAFEQQLLSYGARIYKITRRRRSRRKFYSDLKDIFENHAKDYIAVWENANSLGNIDYLVYAKRYGIPYRIMHCHNSVNSEGWIRGLLHVINRVRVRAIATHFWSVSDQASKWFFGHDFALLPNYRVIDNAVNIQHFLFNKTERNRIRAELCIADDTILACNIGRLHPQKNQFLILNVIAELKRRGIPAHIALIGKGDLQYELVQQAKRLEIADRVHLVGAVSDCKPYYDAADIFFFPSLYEGLSFALLEAQASGLPCLVSDGIAAESLVNENIVVGKLTDTTEQWANNFQIAMNLPRLQKSKLVGTRFDISERKHLFDDFLEHEND